MTEVQRTERTTPRTLPSRASSDLETIRAIVDEALCCHVATSDGGFPRIAPMVHGRVGDELVLHGSHKSTLLAALARGAEACACFTLIDGLVLGRSALHHSMNYRSVIVFGRAREVTDFEEKSELLKRLTERVVPGRWAELRPMSPQEVHATLVVALSLAESGAKLRTGPPIDAPSDVDGPWWAGEVPLALCAGAPIPSPDLPAGIEPGPSVRALALRHAPRERTRAS
ncbi:MAG: pyridoxamine 5'-phosphate oxidase family protein [Planctomycetes bacterium]|nr:pyridoxamine 5'-phosphate oxidase family protein [Planctomycetota bacterium]